MNRPPKYIIRFFRWFCRREYVEGIEGDLIERFFYSTQKRNRTLASLQLTMDVLRLLQPGIVKPLFNFSNRTSMILLRNHLLVAKRVFLKEKIFTAINVFGLATALWTTILIALWIQDEWKFDRLFPNGENTYRILMNLEINGEQLTDESTAFPLGDALLSTFAEVQERVRYSHPEPTAMTIDGKLTEQSLAAADPSFFKVFPLEFLEGDSLRCLTDLQSIVISQSLATSYFGDTTALGKVITVKNGDIGLSFKVSGVFADFPRQSSNQFHALIPIDNLKKLYGDMDLWGNTWFATYLQLEPHVDINAFNQKITNFAFEQAGVEWYTLQIQPYEDQYLYGDFVEGKPSGGRIQNVILFAVVAIFIVLIACFNYVSLAISRTIKRAQEVRIRRVIGAGTGTLIAQFMIQTMLIVALALLLSLIFAQVTLPAFNFLTGKSLYLDLTAGSTYGFLGLLALCTILFSGLYPAASLSRTQINLRSAANTSKDYGLIRKAIVAFQFCISMVLISGAFVMNDQVKYLLYKDLGLSKQNIIFLELDQSSRGNFRELKSALSQETSITEVAASNHNFFGGGIGYTADLTWRNKPKDTEQFFAIQDMDKNLPSMMNLKLKAGRWFSEELASDSANFVINETAALAMGMDQPLKEELELWGLKGKIIGVCEDFHFATLHESVKPLVLRTLSEPQFLFVKAAPGKVHEVITKVSEIHEQFSNLPASYHFLDRAMEESYENEIATQRLAQYLSVVAIAISSMGLLGLILFHVAWKTKEIAIRKVLGAPLRDLMLWLAKEYLLLLMVATITGIPLALWLSRSWLENFAFRVQPSWHWLMAPIAFILIIGSSALIYQTLTVWRLNPADTLKEE